MSNNNVMKTEDPIKSKKIFLFGGGEGVKCLGVILIHISSLLVHSTGMLFFGVGPPLNFGQ